MTFNTSLLIKMSLFKVGELSIKEDTELTFAWGNNLNQVRLGHKFVHNV